MFQLQNRTPFAASLVPATTPQAQDAIVAVVKATYRVIAGGRLELSPVQRELTMSDVWHGDPETTSLKYASDVVPRKPGTDVALIGSAYSPTGKTTHLDVTLQAGTMKKTVCVFGDRFWQRRSFGGPAMGEPVPFEKMPLVYERAFGGKDETAEDEGKWTNQPQNPVGRGLVSNPKRSDLEDVPLPNLEDPGALIESHQDRPPPAGFGFIGPAWQPRLGYAGTYDEQWEKERCPLLPNDFDARFYSAAHPDLVSSEFFKGGEPIRVTNATPNGPLEFRLPEIQIEAKFFIDLRTHESRCDLDTVVIAPDDNQVCLTWRTMVTCHRKLKYVLGARIVAREHHG